MRYIVFIMVVLCWVVGCFAERNVASFSERYGNLSPLQRRCEVRKLGEKGLSSRDILVSALSDEDVSVRRGAFRFLCEIDTANRMVYAKRMIDDSSDVVRLAVIQEIGTVASRTDDIVELLVRAQKDTSGMVTKAANEMYSPFSRNNVPIRHRVDVDRAVEVVKIIPIAKEGWKFRIDPQAKGLTDKWYNQDCNESDWVDIEIEKPWDDYGYKGYVGEAWYRTTFKLPTEPASYKVTELNFGGVDENAWVWVNGVYIGQHAIGSLGWDIPFNLDVTKELKWNETNQITVRVLNSALAGGIWKPIKLEVIKLK